MVIAAPEIAQIPALRQLWKLAFGDEDAFLDVFFERAFSPERCRCVLREEGVAAALYWFDCEWEGRKLAYLYAVATHPACRGQGLCRALMEDVHGLLRSRGYAGVLLVPQAPGLRKMYASMGYREATTVAEFSCTAGKPVSLREVDAETYGVLRREFLPRGGVVQERESLRFLRAFAKFYSGEDFCAAVSGGRILELLGSREMAPGIFAALGIPAGDVRMPGGEVPFAMFLPLREAVPIPFWFGFAFD